MTRVTFLTTTKIALTLLIMFNLSNAYSQSSLTQTVRGTIKDTETKAPLIGATIIVEGIDPIMGSTADIDGNFRLERVPLGRQNFKITYVGYEPFTLSEILVGSGKEVVLEIELKESSITLGEVVVRSNTNKDQPVNSMATLSARTFSVEETSRYAGGLDDPARLNHSCINLPCQINQIRDKMKRDMGLTGFPQLLIRLGYSQKMPFSFRRRVNGVIRE